MPSGRGSGFIGSALIDRLITLGAHITAFYHTVDFQRPLFGQMTVGSPPLSYSIERTVVGDLRNPSDLREAVSVSEPEIIFHLGALTQVTEATGRWYDAAMINAIGTINVLEAMHKFAPSPCDIIVASTDKVYGKGSPGFKFQPHHNLHPDHPYDATKAAADLLARAFSKYHDINLQVTRMANVYGPGDTNWKRIIPYAIRRTMQGKTIQLRSDGLHVRQYLYIDDVVDAYLALAFAMGTKPPFGARAWNFAPDDSHTVLSVIGEIAIIMSERGYDQVFSEILDKADDEADVLLIDDEQARATLKWKPKIPLNLGIENTISWMEQLFNREGLYG
jgi:CDP-glucose 4,6-dehydratase